MVHRFLENMCIPALAIGDTGVTERYGAESKNGDMVICKMWFEKYPRGSSYVPFSVQKRHSAERNEESYGMPSVMTTGSYTEI